MKHIRIRAALVLSTVLGGFVLASVPGTGLAQDTNPTAFKIGPQGDLTCIGTTEDACAFFDEISTPAGTFYLVQGSYSRKPHPSDKQHADAEYVNYYFALLCVREGDTLKPTFDFLEGRERASDIHLHDLDQDGTAEIIVTAIFDSRGSYASVYRVNGPKPERIFTRRANTPNSDFETEEGQARLVFDQRDGGSGGPLRREVFEWNGKEFALKR